MMKKGRIGIKSLHSIYLHFIDLSQPSMGEYKNCETLLMLSYEWWSINWDSFDGNDGVAESAPYDTSDCEWATDVTDTDTVGVLR